MKFKKIFNLLTGWPAVSTYFLISSGLFCVLFIKFGWLMSLGWMATMISILVASYKHSDSEMKYYSEKIKIYDEAKDHVDHAQKALEKAYGYNEQMAKDVIMYSKMLGSGVSIPAANAIVTFAYNTKEKDSIFLIKVDNERKTWSLQIAGYPIHIKTAEWVLDAAKNKCNKIASFESIVWKSKDIHN